MANRISVFGTLPLSSWNLLLLCVMIIGVAAAQNPIPLISQPLVPDAVKPGAAAFKLTVNGTGFVSGALVKWNGNSLPTTFVSGSRLQASVPASDVAGPGTAAITVANPKGTSNQVFFEVTPSSTSIAMAEAEYSVGDVTTSITVGEFNGDGKLDLAVANYDDNSVSVLLGNGDGTFRSPVQYATGSAPYAVAAADFNGDGKQDLAVANGCTDCPFGGSISILLGNGDGTFRAQVTYPTGNNPAAIAIADLNGDGKLDLAVSNTSDSTVSVLLGNGDGTFQPQVPYETAATACCTGGVGVGDLDGDGKLDLVVAAGTGVSVLLGNGDGTFKTHIDYSGGGVAIGDLNSDGKLDLTDGSSVLLGNGDGTFGAAISTGVAGGNAVLADLNGDGKLDLAVANSPSGVSVAVMLGKGDGTFQTAVNYGTSSYPAAVAAADFNGDGRFEVAVASAPVVSVLFQTPIVSLSKSSLKFADELIGTASPSQAVTLKNASGLALKISGIAVTGTNPGDFAQTNTCGSGLAPGKKCVIKITFTPTEGGPRTASVTITDNAAGSPQQIALYGSGFASGPNATLSPENLTFSTQLVGKTSPLMSITLTNYGNATLNITGFAITGANAGDFSQTNACGTSVAAGADCNINVTFTPSQIGNRIAALLVSDNAPDSPQTATLSGTGTVVELSPASLNFGSVVKFHSKTLTATLTNTGQTSLTINSITIASGAFSQTNNCGSSVAAGKSCAINVTFKPTGAGKFTGTMSISDNGGGSPQQVPLSGTGTKPQLGEAVRSALTTKQAARVPYPTGPSSVGTRVMDFVDFTRTDPFLDNGSKRQLLLRFWYPASLNRGCDPARYTSATVWNYFSLLAATRLPEVTTNSCQDAAMLEGTHPLIVFTPGYTATFTDYTFILEDLASRGYVVVSVDHTYEATAEEFPDGKFVTSHLGSHLAKNTLRADMKTLSMVLSVRLDDIKSVLDELARLDAANDSPFAGKLDMSRIAIAGHSLGAVTALLSVERNTSIRAGVIIDGWPDSLTTTTRTPVLLLAAGHNQWSEVEQRLWDQLSGPRVAVNLRGAEHLTPTDAIWLAKGGIRVGCMGSDRTIAAIRDYIAAFLDMNLQGMALDPLLTGPSADYPDAAVTTQKQLLRGKAIDH